MAWVTGGGISIGRWECADGSHHGVDGFVHRKSVPYAILVLVRQGAYEIDGGVRRERVIAGELAVVAAGRPVAFTHLHDTRGRMAFRYLHVEALRDGAFDPLAARATPARLAGPAATRIAALFSRLVTTERASPDLGAGLVLTAVGEVLAALPLAGEAAERLAIDEPVTRVLAWMRTRLHEPLMVDDLARVAGLSRSRLHALFSTRLGRAPLAQLRELRLAEAAHRLLATEDAVGSIAIATGFADGYHLSHAFTRRHGIAPTRYRKQQRLPSQRS